MIKAFLFIRLVHFLLAANQIDNVVEVDVNYWENGVKNQQVEVLLHKQDKNVFVDSINDARKMNDEKIIRTKPSLTINILSNEGDYEAYELWITSDGTGYMQTLDPSGGGTFELSKASVKELAEFLKTKGKEDVVQDDVEFEE
ncbi:hypothetical protein V1499_18725 [Neobacillus sp. SCS-31]|uniref:hypothetical protein n=1 Tax=Neobacillus oceani TaxID=3115292 RepID=UPI0039065B58